MMTLYVLRHGLAEERDAAKFPDDSARPLTAEGRLKLRDIARAMRELEVSFDVLLSSPYVRAKQTAEVVAGILKARKRLQLTANLEPGADAGSLITQIKRLKPAPDSVLLVGHEPDLSELISLWVAGERGFPIRLKKGGLCMLTADVLRAGRCANLEWLLTPRQLVRLAR